jgi:hypothetical protein
MRSQTKTLKIPRKLKPKEETQAYYREFAGRCVIALSWQQTEAVSYGKLRDSGDRSTTVTRTPFDGPSLRNVPHAERLPSKERTVTTSFHREGQNALGRNIDPWKLRDRFLGLDLSPGPELSITLRDFLNSAGYAHDIQVTHGKAPEFCLPPEQIPVWQERQRFLKQWQKLEPAKWKSLEAEFPSLVTYAVNGCGQFPANVVSLTWQDGLPVITWIVQDAWSAIVATVHFDKMRGIRLRACKVCGRPVPDRRLTPHCSDACRHLATMRRLRAI